ncbi:MAG TPA: metal-dependent hydrolase [Burkholderiaceae bacterium]|nr:metal-dependent hydrolase [Burkholderiaceae bacterium]
MDPLAHTLVGAALAETGSKRRSRYATATLIVGANLPDIDAVAMLWGSDTGLYFRRGWSHGVLGLILLPLLLAAAVSLWHRWRRDLRAGEPPFRPGVIIALSYLAVLSHPLLDWLNTYGVRLLMPFDGRWFYGDTLFIIDPWVWLLAATGVVLARSQTASAVGGWLLLGAATTVVILTTDLAPMPVKALWLLGLAALVLLRWIKPGTALTVGIARGSFATLVIYVCAAYGLARVAETAVAAQHPAPLEAQSNPVPGIPHAHRVVLVYEDSYRIVYCDGRSVEVPRTSPDPVVQAAMEDPSIRGFVNWMRYPYWEIAESHDGWTVTLFDLRYVDPGQPVRTIGMARVFVPRSDGSKTTDPNRGQGGS